MIEAIVIIALLVFIAVQEYSNRQERKKLIDAYLAKNLPELKQSEAIEKTKIEPIPDLPPDFVPVEESSDEEFTKAIHQELGSFISPRFY